MPATRPLRPRPTSLALAALLALAVLLVRAALTAPAPVRGAEAPAARLTAARLTAEVGERPRPDQPDLAWELARAKRLGSGGEVTDAPARYERARAAMREMPRHSTRLGLELPSLARAETEGGLAAVAAAQNLGAWTPLGPGNIGGRTRTLVIDPGDPRVMLTGGVSGGVWKTTDGGGTWRPTGDTLANLAINALAMHPANPRILYAGTGEGYFREVVRGTGLPLRGGGVFESRDQGESWRRLPGTGGADFHWVNDLLVSPHDGRRIYAATRTGVWRSRDGGRSWRRLLDPRVQGGCLDLALQPGAPGDFLLAACGTFEQATVWRQPNAQTSAAWEPVLSEPGMGRTYLAFAPSAPHVVYALSASNDPGPGGVYQQGLLAVFRSDAAGAAGSWSARVRNSDPDKLNTLLLTNPLVALQEECGRGEANAFITMGWYVNVLAVDPTDPERLWAAGVDLFRSDDGGRTWGPASYWWAGDPDLGFAHADQHAIVFHPGWDGGGNQTLFLANDGGIYRSDNALAPVGTGIDAACDPGRGQVRWRSLNSGLGITQFYHGAPLPGGRSYLGGTQDNGTLLGGDAAGHDGWRRILGGDGGYVAVDPTDPSVVYAEAQRANFFKSTDGGQSFEEAQNGLDRTGAIFITPFAMDPADPRRLWIGTRRLWRTDDGAALWGAASAPLAGDQGGISALAVATGRPDRVLAGTEEGFLFRSDQALAAGPATVWEVVRPREGFVTSLVFDPSDPDVAYATYGRFGGAHVWRSTDGGRTWGPLDGSGASPLPDIPAHSLVVDPDHPRRLFLGTDLGVFVSTDGGESWAVENTGFARVVTESLALAPDGEGGRDLFAFTHGRGAWRVKLQPLPAKPPLVPRTLRPR